MFRHLGLFYRAILFGLALIFLATYLWMLVFHIGGSVIGNIKFYLFTYRRVYIVTDLPKSDKVLHFVIDYAQKQGGKRYAYYVVTPTECQKIRKCKNKFGMAISHNPRTVYAFKDAGLLIPNALTSDIITQNQGSIDGGVFVLRNKRNDFYYYAAGSKAPLSSLLIGLPVSIINVINN